VSQLQRAVAIKKQIGRLQKQLTTLLGTSGASDRQPRRRLSAAAKARIAAAQKARWAKSRPAKRARKLSAAARKKISQIAKARWAKAKAAGRKTL